MLPLTGIEAPRVEFPLSTPTSIAVDRTRGIFVASAFYSRVQLYDCTGRFVRGWFVPSRGKAINVTVPAPSLVAVSSDAWDGDLVFDDKGTPTRLHPTAFVPRVPACESRQFGLGTANGVRPAVLARAASGDEDRATAVFVATPWRTWILMGPFPVLLLIPLGGYLWRHYRQREAVQ